MTSYVIVLNWNGWKDTIECLESLFRLNGSDFRIVVCDNASTDGSLEKIKEWACGGLHCVAGSPELGPLSKTPASKPIPYLQLTREQAESGHGEESTPLVLIQTGANLGYAGGNNVGLRFALHDESAAFFWILNNDTVVEPTALTELIRFMQQNPTVGLCGSLNRSYFQPNETLLEGGGAYNGWTARVLRPSGGSQKCQATQSARLDFINGASVLVNRAFLTTIGLMEESYFLYFEEHDWAIRGKKKFDLGYAAKSVIYHKEGMAIGSSRNRELRSLLSEQYLSRNRILFTKRFFPWKLPSVTIVVAATAGYWLLRGKAKRARVMLGSILGGLQTIAQTAKTVR